MQVRFISKTEPGITIDGEKLTAEALIAYCARVSSPNQENPNYKRLLEFCMEHGHWSVFQMADMCIEITTTRAIAPQILRHRFDYQEFSQRYSIATSYEIYEARRQDSKNRQNSLDDLPTRDKDWFEHAQEEIWTVSFSKYQEALERQIAKECARSLLPLNTVTRLYMKGSVRSWIHYFAVRCADATQKEHRDIAIAIRDEIFSEHFPLIYSIIMEKDTPAPPVEDLGQVLTVTEAQHEYSVLGDK
jgi:thymidylate synthase (FAD)